MLAPSREQPMNVFELTPGEINELSHFSNRPNPPDSPLPAYLKQMCDTILQESMHLYQLAQMLASFSSRLVTGASV